MNFNYYIPTKILFGNGQLNNLHKEKMPGKKALIVISSGKSVRENGYLERLEKQLDIAKVEYFIYDKISPNPTKKQVMSGAEIAKKENCDFVIGLGGGSSIDAAKSIALMATNRGDYWDYVYNGSGKGQKVKNDPLPIVAITTTAGTGTESDPCTVITQEETDEKTGFTYEKLFPVLSVVDPELMTTVPPHLTAYQGFDALFHSTEGYINILANPMSDIFALKAIELISRSLKSAVIDGKNLEVRGDVALGNTLSGIVESISDCTSEHALEHALSGFHKNLPHGAGLIMISEAYYTHFAKVHACDERMINMAKAMGKKDAVEPMDFVKALVELQKDCGVYNLDYKKYGIDKSKIKDYVKKAFEVGNKLFALDPIKLSSEDAEKILEKSFK